MRGISSHLIEDCDHISKLCDVFHMVFHANQIGITVVDHEGTIVYYNEGQGRIDGLAPEDALGRPICEVYRFTPEDSPTMRSLRTRKPVIDNVHYYRTRHGKLVNSMNAIYPLQVGDTLLGAVCFIQTYTTIGMQAGLAQTSAADGSEGRPDERSALKRKKHYDFSSLIGTSNCLRETVTLAKRAAAGNSSVMLVGETGVGKEIFAQAIHYTGPRREHMYTAINCSAVPEALLEGILFGTAKGAFTGAVDKAGLFEVTDKGTLYLDEVDSMPANLQSKMLRALQEMRVRRIGEQHEREVDVRIISSVGRNPVDLVNSGQLRPDFYYRLGVVRITIPPLRARMDDLHLLVQHFLKKHSESMGIPVPLVTPEFMDILYAHIWPGNVRELEHAIEACLALAEPGSSLEPVHLCRACPETTSRSCSDAGTTPWLAFQDARQRESASGGCTVHTETMPEERGCDGSFFDLCQGDFSMPQRPHDHASHDEEKLPGVSVLNLPAHTAEVESGSIRKALCASAGNAAMAARLLGVSPQLLQYKLKKYGIDRKEFKPKRL